MGLNTTNGFLRTFHVIRGSMADTGQRTSLVPVLLSFVRTAERHKVTDMRRDDSHNNIIIPLARQRAHDGAEQPDPTIGLKNQQRRFLTDPRQPNHSAVFCFSMLLILFCVLSKFHCLGDGCFIPRNFSLFILSENFSF